MSSLLGDIKYALRGFRARPGHAAIVVLTLGLGLGATTAIFSVVDSALLRPLPYRDADRLVSVFETRPRKEFGRMEFSHPNFLDYRARAAPFVHLAGYSNGAFGVFRPEGVELVFAATVTPDFFSVMGVDAALGRVLSPTDDLKTVVLTDATWRKRYGADPAIVGQKLTLDREPYTVVGVLPRTYAFAPLGDAEMYAPLDVTGSRLERRNLHWLNVAGRLAPGVSVERATDALGTIATALAAEYPQADAGAGVQVLSMREALVGNVRPVAVTLLGAVALLLLIACVNVASLLLARSTARRQEMAVRAALGASRGRLLRQLLTEASLLALLGGGLGVVLALWGVDAIVAMIPEAIRAKAPFVTSASVDARVLAFAFVVAILAGVLVGLVPGLQVTRAGAALAAEARTAEPRRRRLRDVLVATEVAVAFALLVGAGMIAKSLVNVLRTDPGFAVDHLLTMKVLMPEAVEKPEARLELHRRFHDRLAALPGVTAVGTTNKLPLGGGGNTIRYVIAGRTSTEEEANIRTVSLDYFRTMGIPLLAGRAFDTRDVVDSAPVLLVNRTLAQRLGEDATRESLVFTFAPDQPARRIVGVVGDENLTALDAPATPVVYVAYPQSPSSFMSFALRTAVPPETLGPAARQAIAEIEPGAAVFGVFSMEQLVEAAPWLFVRRLPALLVGVFAVLALLLVVVGVYGVVGWSVSQRTHEIGIRRALGATEGGIVRMILSRSLAIVGIGVAAGVGAALAAGQALRPLLFGVRAADPTALGAAAAAMLLAAVAACWLPARRATKVQPLEALRLR